MADRVRLDRFLAEAGTGSRAEVKKMIRSGRICVNQEPVRVSDRKIDPDEDEILADGRPVRRRILPILMLNKPSGVVSATVDRHDRTVLDLIHEPWAKSLFPVGRLDKDTEGLLLLTDDGKLSHELLSPKKHVMKTYFAVVNGKPDPELVSRFREGLEIGEKKKTLPAELMFLSDSMYAKAQEHDSETTCRVLVSISEGKFHQIKRMFHAAGREVLYLKRIAMGGLMLDPSLKPGEYRPLSEEEIRQLGEPCQSVDLALCTPRCESQ